MTTAIKVAPAPPGESTPPKPACVCGHGQREHRAHHDWRYCQRCRCHELFPATKLRVVSEAEARGYRLRPKSMDALDWVKVASSRDKARPVLMGYQVERLPGRSLVVATDSYRLHAALVSYELDAGLHDSETDHPVEGEFPQQWREACFPTATRRRYWIGHGEVLRAMGLAAATVRRTLRLRTFDCDWPVVLEFPDGGRVALRGEYLADAVMPLESSPDVWSVEHGGPWGAVVFRGSEGRRAVVMPLRLNDPDKGDVLRVSPDHFRAIKEGQRW